MSYYYDPYLEAQSLSPFEATRRDIQRSIFQVEERLRRRKQAEAYIYTKEVAQRELNQFRYQNQLKMSLSYAKEEQVLRQMQLRYARQRQMEQMKFQHLQKLMRLKQEEKVIQRNIILQKMRDQEFEIKNRMRPQNDQILIKKYQDGTRAYEYNEELKQYYDLADQQRAKSHGKIKYQQNYQQNNEEKQKNKNISNDKSANPRLNKYSESAHKTINQFKIENTDNKIPNNRHNENSILKNKQLSPAKNQKTTPSKNNQTTPIIKNTFKNYQNSQEKQKKNYKDKSLNKISLTPKKNAEIYKDKQISYTNGMKRIQNRLKLSVVVYKDSNFRNIKHEIDHLFNTYQNQCNARQDVKDKINSNPKILKKHKMVVQ